ncbi:MAG: hypothetical protein N3F66_04760 [Spirochaetes bacterium]|nr:hypothetical protein [Spirochaetota bacterium]
MRLKNLYFFTRLFLMVICFVSSLFAQDKTVTLQQIAPEERLYLSSLTIIRYNPLGLETQNRLMYSRKLVDSNSLLFRDTFIAPGLSTKLNPAYLKIGPVIDFQPIAVFNVRFGYEYITFFGTSGFLLSYPIANKDVDFDDDTRKDMKDQAYSTSGHHYFVEPTFQLKAGKVALRTKFPLLYFNIDLKNEDKYFYDATLDTLVPNNKMIWANDTDLLYLDGQLIVGARYSAVFPSNNLEHMRIGPLIAWSFHTHDYTSFNKPTFLMILGWYLKHPNREGVLPYILAGFSFSSDFMGK